MRSDREEVCELAHLFDADLLALLFRRLGALLPGFGRHALGHDQPEIRVVALRKPAAGAAAAACFPVRPGLFAEQRLGARMGKFEFAHALPALYQDRMGQSLLQLNPGFSSLILEAKYHDLT